MRKTIQGEEDVGLSRDSDSVDDDLWARYEGRDGDIARVLSLLFLSSDTYARVNGWL
jgi:hypothetical protein